MRASEHSSTRWRGRSSRDPPICARGRGRRHNVRELWFRAGVDMAFTTRRDPDARGYFGEFGGRFVPETLVAPVEALERAYLEGRYDRSFQAELERPLKHYVGRP